MFNNSKSSNRISIIVLSLASAFLTILAFPPFNMFFVAFIAIIPINIIIYKTEKVRHLLLSAVLFVFSFFGVLLFWVASFMLKETGALIAFLVLFTIMFLLVVLFYFPAMFLSNKLSKYLPSLRWLIIPLVFTVMEYMRTLGFLGFPWGIIAYSQWSFLAFIQISDITGMLGVSFLIYLSNSVLANIIVSIIDKSDIKLAFKQNLKPIITCSIVFMVTFVYGSIKLYTETNDRELREKTQMSLVQKAFDPNHSWRSIYTSEPAVKGSKGISGMAERLLLKPQKFNSEESPDGVKQNGTVSVERLARLAKEAALSEPSLIIFSELATADSYGFYMRNYKNLIENLGTNSDVLPSIYNTSIFYNVINETSKYYLIGTSLVENSTNNTEYDNYNYYNGAIFVSPNGDIIDDYAKMLLVPGGEAYPFDSEFWVKMPLFGHFVRFVHGEFEKAGAGRWGRGEKFTVFNHPYGYTFSTLICYESAFGDFARKFVYDGAQSLVVITEDAWSYSDSAQWQHFYMMVFRAIENRRDIVQNGNSGVTGHVASTGNIISTLEFWKPDHITTSVSFNDNKTIYTLYGEWFVKLCFLIVFVLIIISFSSFIRKLKKTIESKKINHNKIIDAIKNKLINIFPKKNKLSNSNNRKMDNIFDDTSDSIDSSLSSFSSIMDDFDSDDEKKR